MMQLTSCSSRWRTVDRVQPDQHAHRHLHDGGADSRRGVSPRRILDALRARERTAGELGEETGLNQTNLSKHLQLLHQLQFVTRRKDGLFVYYQLANEDVFQLCDIMCGRIARARSSRSRRPRARSTA